MALIDEKGRLGGRINVIDLLVLVAVLVVAARVAYVRLAPAGVRSFQEKERPLEVLVVVGPVRDATAEAIQVGDRLRETKSNDYLGEVIRVEIKPAEVVTQGPDGRFYEGPSGNRKDVWITLRGPGRVSENTILLGTKEIRIGTQLGLKTNLYAVTATVMKIDTGGSPGTGAERG